MGKKLAACAVVVMLALVGCGSQMVELDREVTVEGLTARVPSVWVEDETDYGNVGGRSFSTTDDEEDFGYIGINYSPHYDDDETPEEDMKERKEWYETDLEIDDFEYQIVDERVVDGAECITFEESHTTEPSHKKRTGYYIYVTSVSTDYMITVAGNVDVDRFLDSLSLD